MCAARFFSHDVFLCFAGEDRDTIAYPLLAALERLGVTLVFLDEVSISAGENIDDAINRALRRTKLLVPIVTRDFHSKRDGPPGNELRYACSNRIRNYQVVPIFYHGIQSQVAKYPLLAHIQGATVKLNGDGRTFDELAKDIQTRLEVVNQSFRWKPLVEKLSPRLKKHKRKLFVCCLFATPNTSVSICKDVQTACSRGDIQFHHIDDSIKFEAPESRKRRGLLRNADAVFIVLNEQVKGNTNIQHYIDHSARYSRCVIPIFTSTCTCEEAERIPILRWTGGIGANKGVPHDCLSVRTELDRLVRDVLAA